MCSYLFLTSCVCPGTSEMFRLIGVYRSICCIVINLASQHKIAYLLFMQATNKDICDMWNKELTRLLINRFNLLKGTFWPYIHHCVILQ